MNNQRYSPEFKDGAVRQVIDRGYSCAESPDSPGHLHDPVQLPCDTT